MKPEVESTLKYFDRLNIIEVESARPGLSNLIQINFKIDYA